MLNAEVKKNIFFARARKYGSAREAALDRTEVPVSVYDNLVQAVHQNMNAMHRYTALRKKLMQLDELHMYDVYTPMVKDFDMHEMGDGGRVSGNLQTLGAYGSGN